MKFNKTKCIIENCKTNRLSFKGTLVFGDCNCHGTKPAVLWAQTAKEEAVVVALGRAERVGSLVTQQLLFVEHGLQS